MFPQTAASFIKVYTDVLLSTRNLLPATAQERLLPWAFEIRETAQPEHMPSLAAARCQTADSASHCTKPHSDTLGCDQHLLNTTLQQTSKLHAQPLASTAKVWSLETLSNPRLWPTARASNRSEILASIPKSRLQIAAWKRPYSTQWWISWVDGRRPEWSAILAFWNSDTFPSGMHRSKRSLKPRILEKFGAPLACPSCIFPRLPFVPPLSSFACGFPGDLAQPSSSVFPGANPEENVGFSAAEPAERWVVWVSIDPRNGQIFPYPKEAGL